MSKQTHPHQRAIELLSEELVRLCGKVVARYIAELHDETRKQVQAVEFIDGIMRGEVRLSRQQDEYLAPYLEPVWAIDRAIKILQAAD